MIELRAARGPPPDFEQASAHARWAGGRLPRHDADGSGQVSARHLRRRDHPRCQRLRVRPGALGPCLFIRGGSWTRWPEFANATTAGSVKPTEPSAGVGFRLARDQ